MNHSYKTICLSLFLSLLLGQELDISYVKYYQTREDFLLQKSMMATERRSGDYVQVSFNEKNEAVLFEAINAQGQITSREALEYAKGKLIRKGQINNHNQYTKMIDYRDNELWRKEFIDWWIVGNETLSLGGDQTRFTIPNGNEVRQIQFETIDGKIFGQIELDYDYLGNLSEERWQNLLTGDIIRRFQYRFDVMANVNQIWEYGRQGELISHMSLEMAPADQLYKMPPPRTGNSLSEAEIIMKEIQMKRTMLPYSAIIPRTEFDELLFKSGQRMSVDFISIGENEIKLKLSGTQEFLHIPKGRVESLTSRNGMVIYPEPIRNANYK
ncbi:MAG: hypothetical protein HN657_06075 [Candidatus Marinimicrobia bacterium]|jgi:hypothetical protein|nr:hypothetical protein [Candidatus Neomarinimicrobiota bacterium]MBT3496173.1 hypothetical protein [Candidatus Neomarinimicrobiota bacterium]MBT3731844.1 hypothetical protein [Candidatus Neomarinimicrobiota bacterium]MBT4178140.1 hypothetical protein [Candidatus Neomarinimicrobiota bacterium]MBT5356426.1 hypothetical protein [Candidatus Neomarinimicrobiota bacterium]